METATLGQHQWIQAPLNVFSITMTIYVILYLKKTVNTMEKIYSRLQEETLITPTRVSKTAKISLLIASTGFTTTRKKNAFLKEVEKGIASKSGRSPSTSHWQFGGLSKLKIKT